MNYIINPTWFYWISIADKINNVFLAFALLTTVGGLITTIVSFIDDEREILKLGIKICVVSIFLWVGYVLVPAKETLIEMMVARVATYENANWTLDTVKSAVDYIVEAIGSLK